ncbi:Beta-galactosidase [Crateriforma conspicua]|nr:Beta-galactosidase [Crateriforma conspicua]
MRMNPSRVVVVLGMLLVWALALENACGEKPVVTQVENSLVEEAVRKTGVLNEKMEEAKAKGIDVTREESTLWFAQQFLKFADWDESHPSEVAYLFAQYGPYEQQSETLAKEIPEFQRRMVVETLDQAIETLSKVISGKIQRRPVNKIDWRNVKVGDNMLVSHGKPVFLYDYFSKSVGRPLRDGDVYNDHLGAIYHGGENLYPPEYDRAINSFLLKENRDLDLELLREVTGVDDTNVGFLLYWMQGIPEWVEKREPEVRFGRSTFTGFDIDNPLVKEVWGTIARETGALTRGKRVTRLGYILANEPHWHSIASNWTRRTGEMQQISSYTLEGFRQWLRAKYSGDINRLNQNWETQFLGFETVQIQIPISAQTRGTPVFYDWARYNMDRVISWYAMLQGELRKGNPDADTHIKLIPHLYTDDDRAHGIDIESLTQLTSIIGDDAKTRPTRRNYTNAPEPWEQHYAFFWEELCMSYDFMESVAPDSIHINSESHFLSAARWRKLDLSTQYVKCVYWLATLHGMDANFAWFWARDPDGSPEDRLEGELNFADLALAGSFAGSVNQQPHIANAYTQVMLDLNSFSEEVIALRKQRRPLRLFHSETSAINKRSHMTEQFALYEAMFFDGFPVGFATEKIIKTQDNASWDAILIYRTPYVTVAELNALQSYLDQGGTVIVDGEKSLAKDEYGNPHAKRLEAGQGRLVVLKSNPSPQQIRDIALRDIAISMPAFALVEDNGSDRKGCRWQAVKQDDGSYLVSIINLGKHDADLQIVFDHDKPVSVTNLLTGQVVGTDLSLDSQGVALLKIHSQSGN